jgi:hypothetical protein
MAKVVNQLDFCSDIGKYHHCNDRFTGGGYCGVKGEPRVSEIHIIESNHDYFNGIAMKGGVENCPIIISGNECWDVSRRIKSDQYFQHIGIDAKCLTGNYNYKGIPNQERGYCLKAECRK